MLEAAVQAAEQQLTPRAKMQVINFYRESGLYGELSNFFLLSVPLSYNNRSYTTSEHLYQSLKFLGPMASLRSIEYADCIRTASTPNKAKILARQKCGGGYNWQKELRTVIEKYKDIKPREDWEDVKADVMLLCLKLKFQQNLRCRKVLLSTGDCLLVEHTSNDEYWGDGGNGIGQNMLGKLLMQVRTELVSHNETKRAQPEDNESVDMSVAKCGKLHKHK